MIHNAENNTKTITNARRWIQAKRVVGSAILFGSFLLLPAYEFVLHQFNLEKTWITQVLMAVGFCGVILLVKLFVNAPAKKMINDSRRSCGERELSARASQAEIDRLVSSSVLYLRSFGDEAFTSLALDDNLSWPFSIKTHEERLVKSLSIVGQVVTVGRPKKTCRSSAQNEFIYSITNGGPW